jgi:uroporphyrinogen-III synthase
LHRTELITALQNEKIETTVEVVYNKQLEHHTFSPHTQAALFFSPSQVDAFIETNPDYYEQPSFCIGETTGNYLKEKGFTKIHISEQKSEASVIDLLINYFTKNT